MVAEFRFFSLSAPAPPRGTKKGKQRLRKQGADMYGKENRVRYRVYVLSVAAHHPTGSRAQVFPDHPLCCGRTPSTPRSITSLTLTRGASPVPQFDAQPATTPRAPPNERVLSHVGSCNDSLCGHSPSSTLYRVHDRA